FYAITEQTPVPAEAAMSAGTAESIAQRVLAARFGGAPLDSLVEAGRRRGVAPADLAGRLGIGLDVLGKRGRRLVQATTVPAVFIARLSDLVGAAPTAVRAYLDAGPRPVTAGALLQAVAPPAEPEPQSFAAALAASALTDPAARARWLALADA